MAEKAAARTKKRERIKDQQHLKRNEIAPLPVTPLSDPSMFKQFLHSDSPVFTIPRYHSLRSLDRQSPSSLRTRPLYRASIRSPPLSDFPTYVLVERSTSSLSTSSSSDVQAYCQPPPPPPYCPPTRACQKPVMGPQYPFQSEHTCIPESYGPASQSSNGVMASTQRKREDKKQTLLSLQYQIKTMEWQSSQDLDKHKSLQEDYRSLRKDYRSGQKNYKSLQEDYKALWDKYNDTTQDLFRLKGPVWVTEQVPRMSTSSGRHKRSTVATSSRTPRPNVTVQYSEPRHAGGGTTKACNYRSDVVAVRSLFL